MLKIFAINSSGLWFNFFVVIVAYFRCLQLIVFFVIWPHKRNNNINNRMWIQRYIMPTPRIHIIIHKVINNSNIHDFLALYFGIVDEEQCLNESFVRKWNVFISSFIASVHQQSPIIDRVAAGTPPTLSNLSSDSAYDKFRLLNGHHVSFHLLGAFYKLIENL